MKKVDKTTSVFIANDGTEFLNEESCITYEKENQKEWVEYDTYLHAEKWEVFEEMKSDGFHFNEDDEELAGNLKYILNEISVRIKIHM
jgi:hypothetical protein